MPLCDWGSWWTSGNWQPLVCLCEWIQSGCFGVSQPPKELQWRYSCFMEVTRGLANGGKKRLGMCDSLGAWQYSIRAKPGRGGLVTGHWWLGGLWKRGSTRPGLCLLAWLALSPDNRGRGQLFLSLLSFRGALDPLSYELSGCGGLSWSSAPLLWTKCPLSSSDHPQANFQCPTQVAVLDWCFSDCSLKS